MHETGNQFNVATEPQLESELSLKPGTLRKMRKEHRSPPFFKIGRLVRYDRRAVRLWIGSLPSGGEEPVKNEEAQAVMAAT